MNITVSPRQSVRFLALASSSLALVSLIGQTCRYLSGVEGLPLVNLFNVDYENNIPTLYAALILLLCAVLLFLIALTTQRSNNRFAIHWWSLSVIFLYLSLDESLRIHESINLKLNEEFQLWTGGAWDILNSTLLIVFILTYTKFFLCLPSKIQRLFFLAGSLFVLGGIGIELIGARYFESIYHQPIFIAEVITTIEELLEMIGITIFIYALLSYLGSFLGGINVILGKPGMSEEMVVQRESKTPANRQR